MLDIITVTATSAALRDSALERAEKLPKKLGLRLIATGNDLTGHHTFTFLAQEHDQAKDLVDGILGDGKEGIQANIVMSIQTSGEHLVIEVPAALSMLT